MKTIIKYLRITVIVICLVCSCSIKVSSQVISTIDSLTVSAPDSITATSFHLHTVLQPRKLGVGAMWYQFCIGYDIALDSNFTQIVQSRNPFTRPVGCVCLRGCSVNDCDKRQSDSIYSFDFTISRLQSNTRYYYRVYYSGRLIDYSVRSRFSSTNSIILSNSAPNVTAPIFQRNTEISNQGFRLSWDSALGNISHYLLDVATDSSFRTTLPAYSNIMIKDTHFLVTNLLPTTQYFYRIRSANAVRTSGYSRIGREYTLPNNSFRAEQLVSSRPVLTNLYNRVDSTFYRYSVQQKLITPQIDSVLLTLIAAGFNIEEAYSQSSRTCNNVSNGVSELVVKLRQPNNPITSFGFNRTNWSWSNDCDCPYFRIYDSFITTGITSTKGLQKAFVVPNPISDMALLKYSLLTSTRVKIELFDMLGRPVLLPIQEERPAGDHETTLSVASLVSGVYTARLTIQTATAVQTESLRLLVAR